MDDNTHTSFGTRLKFALIQAGLTSNRSPYGVNVARLAEITKHSPQICRKYLSNTALPSVDTIISLSKKLEVSAGWLLFGDEPKQNKGVVSLSPALLRYVIEEGLAVQVCFKSNNDFSGFLIHIMEKIEGFDLPENQIKKIIQCMITSARCFNRG